MPNQATPIRANTPAHSSAAQALGRATQTRQRAEALFQQAERLRRMSAQQAATRTTSTKIDTEKPT